MSSACVAPLTEDETPGALVVGHLTRDRLPDGGWRVGGAALYAARAASLRGLRVAVVTSAAADVTAAARQVLPGVALHVVPSTEATTFENRDIHGGRIQYVRAVATPLRARDVPSAWRKTPVILLAPVGRDFRPSLAGCLRPVTLGLAPQGWLRTWDTTGRVRPRALTRAAESLIGACDAVIISRDDLAGPDPTTAQSARAERTLHGWADRARRLIVTHGRDGADLWEGGRVERFSGSFVNEVDPTGAGDVFAMTFLCELAVSGSTRAAISLANQVAAMAVEGVGVAAIPAPEAARARFGAC